MQQTHTPTISPENVHPCSKHTQVLRLLPTKDLHQENQSQCYNNQINKFLIYQ